MEMQKLGSKILKVMEAVKSISKDGTNAFHKYRYVTDAAIVTKIRKELIANKLICWQKQLSYELHEDIMTIQVQFTLMDVESGEKLETTIYASGQDKGDKKPYKATTGAEKYFLKTTFLIPSDDDPENEREPRKRVTKDELKAFDESLPPKAESGFISHPEALSLFALMGQDKARQTSFKAHLEALGISGTNKIPKERYTEMYEWIIKQKAEVEA